MLTHQARAVSLDDLTSPDPIMERTSIGVDSGQKRGPGRTEAKLCGNDRHPDGRRRFQRLRSRDRVHRRLERGLTARKEPPVRLVSQPDPTGESPMNTRKAARPLRRYVGRACGRLC
jgi:hypothetical protein